MRDDQISRFRNESRKEIPAETVAAVQAQGLPVETASGPTRATATDRRGRKSSMVFADDGLPERLIRPSGLEYRFTHTEEGRLESITYPSARELQFRWDDAGNLIAMRQPKLGEYKFQHAEGRCTGMAFPDGRSYSFRTSPQGRIEEVVDRSGAVTKYSWTANGDLSAITDALGHTTRFIRDATNDLSAIEFPDGELQQYAYDSQEHSAITMAPDGSATTMHVDPQGSIDSIEWPAGARATLAQDADGRITEARNRAIALSRTYDAAGRLISERTSYSGETRFEYDAEDRLTSIVSPFGDVIRYAYDDDGRLAGIQDWDRGITRVEHNGDDQITALRFPNGVVLRHDYDPSCRIRSSSLQSASGAAITRSTYTYDSCARMAGSTFLNGDGSETTRIFNYDPEDRLTKEQAGSDSTDYIYDVCGNMLRAGVDQYTYGVFNQPVSLQNSEIAYDGRGNATSFPGVQGKTECRFSGDGTLERCTTSSGVTEFLYDGLGRRVGKRSGVAVWRYGWAGHALLWEEHRATPNSAAIRRDYLFLPGTFLPIGFRENGRTYWLETDGRNAVVSAVDSKGQLAWRAEYDAFGRATITLETVRQPFRLEGQYSDDETGLYYSLARYYSPTLRSYVSRDPRWLQYLTTNYSYARNDPYNHSDPTGGFPPLIAAVGIAALAGAVIGGVVGGISAAAQGKSVWGGIAGGVVEGAVASAGAVLAGAAAVAAGVGAVAAGAIVIAGSALSAGIGAFAGTLTQQGVSGDPISVKCALVSAGWAFGITVALAGLGAIPGVRRVALAVARRAVKSGVGRWAQRLLRNVRIRKLPQGVSKDEFGSLSKKVLDKTKQLGLGDDAFVHGSRGSGLSTPASDIDVGVRVAEDKFDQVVKDRFKNAKPGSAKEATMQHALQTGKLNARDAGLHAVRDEVAQDTSKKVQVSLIKKGGQFDTGPIVPLDKK